MGGYPNQMQQQQIQLPPELSPTKGDFTTNVQASHRYWKEHVEVKPKTFEQKAKETIQVIGDNWGYGGILMALVGAYFGNKFKGEIKSKVKHIIGKW